jgi:hypothetical protein
MKGFADMQFLPNVDQGNAKMRKERIIIHMRGG